MPLVLAIILLATAQLPVAAQDAGTGTDTGVSGSSAQPLQARIDALKNAPPGTVLQLAPGLHRLPRAGLRIHGLRDVTIDGGGSALLLATDPEGTGISVQNSKNVTFRGFALDFDPLPFTQATITGIDRERRTIDFTLHDGYPPLRERVVKDGQSVTLLPRIHLFEANAHRWKPGAPDYAAASMEKTGPRSGRAGFPAHVTHADLGHFATGDRIAISTLSGNAVRISENCADLLWEDITVHSAPFVTFTLRSNEDSGIWRRIKIIPGPPPPGATQPRLLSSNADGFNSSDTRRGPLLEDCEFAFLGDDSVNLHGPVTPVGQWLDADTLDAIMAARNNRVDLLSRPGDEIRFLRAPDYRVIATRRILGVRRIEEDATRWIPLAFDTWSPSGIHPGAENISIFRVTLAPESGAGFSCQSPASGVARASLPVNVASPLRRGTGFQPVSVASPFRRGTGFQPVSVASPFRRGAGVPPASVDGSNLADTTGLFVDFPALAAPGYVIRNNHFHDHRARALRIQASDGIITGNRIERIKQVGISIGPEYAFWREAGWVNNVIIEQNTLRDIAEGSNSWSPAAYTLGAICTLSRMDARQPGEPARPHPPGNRNITIRDNTIENCPLDALHTGATDTRARPRPANRIENTATLPPPAKQRAGGDHGLSVGDGIKITP
ncbi:MAG: right-handed parallel beta-helix repeat-containing protein [Opitutaceae bacterium]|jgi:hypothetical protein|nr:right-handed parallel beta-helix repeat-containing protein [Opitutaceae bacterium]